MRLIMILSNQCLNTDVKGIGVTLWDEYELPMDNLQLLILTAYVWIVGGNWCALVFESLVYGMCIYNKSTQTQ